MPQQYNYWYTITSHTFYKVKATSREEADQKLDECEDLAYFYHSEESGEPSFYGSTEPEPEA